MCIENELEIEKNDLIIEYIDDLFREEANVMSQLLGCLIDYLIISNINFKEEMIKEIGIEEDILIGFVKWFELQDKEDIYNITMDECIRIVNFIFKVNI